jgi:hypothetical protein
MYLASIADNSYCQLGRCYYAQFSFVSIYFVAFLKGAVKIKNKTVKLGEFSQTNILGLFPKTV